jgi:hypothetical protein
MRLYHFTCAHGAKGIEASGLLVPNRQVTLGGRELVWLTPFAAATAADLGLTRVRLKCDRMAYRYEVETDLAVPWSSVRAAFDPRAVQGLEAFPGAKPAFWYVAPTSLPITRPE